MAPQTVVDVTISIEDEVMVLGLLVVQDLISFVKCAIAKVIWPLTVITDMIQTILSMTLSICNILILSMVLDL